MGDKFKYAPGRPGVGTKGNDGTAGSQGIAMYFTDLNPINDINLINSRISNNLALWAVNPPVALPGNRVYVTGDMFFDSEGKCYEIDAESNTYTYKFASLNMGGFFVPLGISSDSNYARYFNSNASPKYIIDNVYTDSGAIDYSLVPSNIYKIAPKNYSRIEYSNIELNGFNPFTVYSSGETAVVDDDKALALVRDISENSFRLGNLDLAGQLRNVNLIFDISSLKQKKNGQNVFNSNTPQGAILTNYEIAANSLFDGVFNPKPTSFMGWFGQPESSISWNLRDFSNDPDVTGTLYVYTNKYPYNGTTIRFDSSTIRPLIFQNIDASGSVRINGTTEPNAYSFYISLNKNGWTRNSDIQTIYGGSLTINPSTYYDVSSGTLNIGFDINSNTQWNYFIMENPSSFIYNVRSVSTGGMDGSLYIDTSINLSAARVGRIRISPIGGAYHDISIYQPGSITTITLDISAGEQTGYDDFYYGYRQNISYVKINDLPAGTSLAMDISINFYYENDTIHDGVHYLGKLHSEPSVTIQDASGNILYSISPSYDIDALTTESYDLNAHLSGVNSTKLPLKVTVFSDGQFSGAETYAFANVSADAYKFKLSYESGPSVSISDPDHPIVGVSFSVIGEGGIY